MRAVWVHATLLQDVFGSTTPNGAFWSIAPEWQIYFIFPILLFFVRRLSALSATLITTAAVVGGYLLATHVHAFHKFLDLSPVFLALFAFGMLATRLTTGTSRWERVPWGIIAAVSAVAMLLVINLSGSRAVINQFFWVDLGVGFVVAPAIASMTVGRSRWLRSILESRLIVFLGVVLVQHLLDPRAAARSRLALLGQAVEPLADQLLRSAVAVRDSGDPRGQLSLLSGV